MGEENIINESGDGDVSEYGKSIIERPNPEQKVKAKKKTKKKGIMVKNKLNQKLPLYFPFGRTVVFKPREEKELTREEIDSVYFQNRKNYFQLKEANDE